MGVGSASTRCGFASDSPSFLATVRQLSPATPISWRSRSARLVSKPNTSRTNVPKRLGLIRSSKLRTGQRAQQLMSHRSQTMSPRLIISDNRDDPGNPLVLDGEAIDEAASDPVAIGKLMVDQV